MSDINFSRLKEMAIRGAEYAEVYVYEYFGEEIELSLSPLEDQTLIPVAGVLESKFSMDVDEASEEIEESREDDGDVDPSKLDEDFVVLMGEVAVEGINTDEGDAEGATEDDLCQVFGIAEEDEDNIGMRGGTTLEVAQDILDLSSDNDSAESFRR
jgi:hypothetical protein